MPRRKPCPLVRKSRLQGPAINGTLPVNDVVLVSQSPVVNGRPRRPSSLPIETPYHVEGLEETKVVGETRKKILIPMPTELKTLLPRVGHGLPSKIRPCVSHVVVRGGS